jgi:D-sedoheptulose 7-phosphate isomerase
MNRPTSSLFGACLQEHLEVFARLNELEPAVRAAANTCAGSLRHGGKILFCGNGGSAGDAQHIAAELIGRLVDDRPALAGLALTTDTSALTCVGNDYGFDQVFSRQVLGLGRQGDVLVLISTSGNSENLMTAAAAARSTGVSTIGLLGRDGGRLREAVDQSIVVPSHTTARIQEAHIFIGHMLCALVERELGHGRWSADTTEAAAADPAR